MLISIAKLLIIFELIAMLFVAREFPRNDILDLGASAAATDFYECFQAILDTFSSHQMYQVNPYSSR